MGAEAVQTLTATDRPPSIHPQFLTNQDFLPMLPFQNAVAPDLSAVNDMIIKELHSDVGLVENIGHYIVDAGGKRLRPIKLLLTARCQEYSAQRPIELATNIAANVVSPANDFAHLWPRVISFRVGGLITVALPVDSGPPVR